ncbi:MAG: glyoxalase/bleomycin resistance protein/dioxygenase [Rhodobacteraceae bacterium]|nr:MAG: glyoxalase/bleomycin resistance protein/dioxygenase [Paracoccaceae bacterium]
MAETFLYLTLGTNDLPRAIRFYDAALAPLGLVRRATEDTEVGYGHSADHRTRLWITLPFDGRTATTGNGSMPALVASSQDAVKAFHAASLAHGGTDEGAPGLRPYGPAFFAAYVRDPDGNKLSAVHEGTSNS